MALGLVGLLVGITLADIRSVNTTKVSCTALMTAFGLVLATNACGPEQPEAPQNDSESLSRQTQPRLRDLGLGGFIPPPPPPLPPPPPRDRVYDLSAGQVAEYVLTVPSSGRILVETANSSRGVDPVLHLMEITGAEVTTDDNGGGGVEARISMRATPGHIYLLLVRAASASTGGSTRLSLVPGSWRTAVFGGTNLLDLGALVRREQIESVRVPNGAMSQHRLYLFEGTRLVGRAALGGTAGGALLSLNRAISNGRLLVATTQSPGPVRVVINDVAITDTDRDGLGDALEAAVGTCARESGRVGGFSCARVASSIDTDGDGLSDSWEVLGKRDMVPHQPLPAWGANPRHKDLFIEVDYAKKTSSEPTRRVSASVVRAAAARWQDTFESYGPLRAMHRAGSVGNPDGLPGVAFHVDSGMNPPNPAEATLFGDWGGYTVLEPVTEGQRASYVTAWETNMASARRGVFQWVLGVNEGSGQNRPGPGMVFNIGSAAVLAHELGHGLGMGHSGPDFATGPVDPNCKPNYRSLMNYAFQNSEDFSDGLGMASINNASVLEYGFLSSSQDRDVEADMLEGRYQYYVERSTWSVDWNRDGYIAPSGQHVRAYANDHPGGSCEWTRYNRVRVANAASTVSPAVDRLGDRTYVFNSVFGLVIYTHSTEGFECAAASTTPCGSFQSTSIAYIDAQQGIDIIRLSRRGPDRLLLVTIDALGQVWSATLEVNARGQEVWSRAEIIATGASGEPSLGSDDPTGATLVYKNTQDVLHQLRFHPDTGWTTATPALRPDGTQLVLGPESSPGIGRGYTRWRPGSSSLYGAFATANGRLRLFIYDTAGDHWEQTDLVRGSDVVEGRPSIAWVPNSYRTEFPGRLYLAFPGKNGKFKMQKSYVEVTRLSSGALQRTERIGLEAFFDNSWHGGYGIDLFYRDWGVNADTNLRAATARENGESFFTPKADGIHDFEFTNYNDWETIRDGLCQSVNNPGGTVANPVPCP